MCGIAGFALRHPAPWAGPIVTDMTDAIAHRGPDSDGHLSSPDQRVWLGFRRLAIRDLDTEPVGAIVVTGDDGSVATYRAGDAFLTPAGFTGTWDVIERAKKFYAMYE